MNLKAEQQGRILYGQEHWKMSIRKFQQYILFTDEKHFFAKDLSNQVEYELRQPSSEKRLRDLEENKEDGLNVVVHVAIDLI
jgi:hypothetical protein